MRDVLDLRAKFEIYARNCESARDIWDLHAKFSICARNPAFAREIQRLRAKFGICGRSHSRCGRYFRFVGERTMVAGDRSQIEGFDRFDGSWNWHWPVPSLFS
ncbi:hypothetical protein [Amphibacillus indicireducens]|uniref:hypothetical protein n=1 Tax=Amphibacillus indicireducens TaxID=1076330 RepID=UPI0031EE509C